MVLSGVADPVVLDFDGKGVAEGGWEVVDVGEGNSHWVERVSDGLFVVGNDDHGFVRDVGAHSENARDFLVDALERCHTSDTVAVLVVAAQQVLIAFDSLELDSDFTIILSKGEDSFVALLNTHGAYDETDVVNLLLHCVLAVFDYDR